MIKHRGVEQLVARQAHNLEVARSSRTPATKLREELLFFSFFVFTPYIIIRRGHRRMVRVLCIVKV